MNNLSLQLKYIYLSFLQAYFETHSRFTWALNPRDTKIIIADKYATELGIAAKRPSIILDRGPIGWTNSFRNEALPVNNGPISSGDRSRKNTHELRDLIQGSLTLNVVAKSSFIADSIANEAFIAISAYREAFKEKGITKVNRLSIGQERIVSVSSAEIEVSLVPIEIAVIWDQKVSRGEYHYNARVYSGEKEITEGVDYIVKPSGTQIELLNLNHAETDLTVDFTDAITLEEKIKSTLISVEGNNKLYTVPSGGTLYGYYQVLADIDITQT